MGLITDYPKVKELVDSNVLLTDGENGTKGILAKDLGNALLGLMSAEEIFGHADISKLHNVNTEKLKDNDVRVLVSVDGETFKSNLYTMLYDLADVNRIYSKWVRRNLWRGKSLGSAVTDEQYEEIDSGSFRNLYLGDYWSIGDVNWRIVDFDYWYGSGDTPCYTHHLVIMPDGRLYTGQINSTLDATGAYVNSEMYKTGLERAKTIVKGAFTADHVLKHREYLQNAITNGYASAGAWFDSEVELPNEPMMYGSYIYTPAGTGVTMVNRHSINNSQLAGMRINATLINPGRQNQWLRDVASDTRFASVRGNGYAGVGSVIDNDGIRPIFGLCKKNAS